MKNRAEEFELDDFMVSPKSNYSLEVALDALAEHDEILKAVRSKDKSDAKLFQSLLLRSQQGQALFRRAKDASDAPTLLWLSRIKEAAELYMAVSNFPKFEGLTQEKMREISRMSPDVSSVRAVSEVLAGCGIALIFERQLKGMKLDGAVFRLSSGNPVVAMTLRYPRLDYFWFTLMHELSHINLHLERLDTAIIENLDEDAGELIELEANRQAKETFVSKNIWRNCPPKLDPKDNVLLEFAESQGLHPAIVAGMLRFEFKNYGIFSGIINRHNVRELIFGYD